MIVRSAHTRRFLICVHLCASAVSLSACAGPRNYENDNDRLRRQNMELTEANAALTERVTGLEARLAAEEARHGVTLPAGLHEPLLSRLRIHAYSGGVDTNGDGADDAVRIYLETLDDRGRFVQVIATADVTISAAEPGKPAVTVATHKFDPAAFDAAYRAGLTGTHYTLEVPLTAAVPAGAKQLNVAVKITDLRTTRSQSIDQFVPWSRR